VEVVGETRLLEDALTLCDLRADLTTEQEETWMVSSTDGLGRDRFVRAIGKGSALTEGLSRPIGIKHWWQEVYRVSRWATGATLARQLLESSQSLTQERVHGGTMRQCMI
jgi:hypothetical protein